MELLRAVHLEDKANAYARTLSGGMKRRLLIAKALVHTPPVIVLDEPTAGVDVELRRQLWELVSELNADGVTVVLTTHYLEEAEELCDRIAIINHGKLIANKPTRELVAMAREKVVVLTLDREGRRSRTDPSLSRSAKSLAECWKSPTTWTAPGEVRWCKGWASPSSTATTREADLKTSPMTRTACGTGRGWAQWFRDSPRARAAGTAVVYLGRHRASRRCQLVRFLPTSVRELGIGHSHDVQPCDRYLRAS
jgi:ABC-2 type transport system ATP-binding protein